MATRKKQPGRIPAIVRKTWHASLFIASALALAGAAQAQLEQETVVHRFKPFPLGASPYSGVLRGATGNFYGTTVYGGAYSSGIVYKINSAGQLTVIHHFTGGADGGNPYASLVVDAAGSLYGTTFS